MEAISPKLTVVQVRVMRWLSHGWAAEPGAESAVMANGSRICNVDTMQQCTEQGLRRVMISAAGVLRHQVWRYAIASINRSSGTENRQTAMEPIEVARRWREERGYVGRGGVVVIFDGEVQSWVSELRNPDHWQPGCIAIAEDGRTWTAIAGTERDGALMWLPNEPV
ncbi:hypothetical protein LGM71_29340 [Burkholderia sp. AU33545]|uniref:hypothetical protein n=1 Tax=Burkholderia sp. AU33545 TaxID=2879631 RepID=UPI001CF52AB2|nr:hypothetical protein [Burkholderia sp. AU33545]MCA8205147.1 hypothetical protein [Burkholderia sp. AU33545]